MTTIAYKDGIIAYDSRSLCGGTIVDDDFEKSREVDGVRYFFCGTVSDIDDLVAACKAKDKEAHGDCSALVVENGELYYCGMNDKESWKLKIKFDVPRAIGSGEDHALTAMDMGATAKEAVKWAMKRDTGTGGRVRTYKVK